MGYDWSITVESNDKYFILKKNVLSRDYLIVRKPGRRSDAEKNLRIFTADSDQAAREYGEDYAVQNGLFP